MKTQGKGSLGPKPHLLPKVFFLCTPLLPVFQLWPAYEQVYNLFHHMDLAASHLKLMLERHCHTLSLSNIPVLIPALLTGEWMLHTAE